MKKACLIIINYSLFIIVSFNLNAQLKWVNVDSFYQPLPSSVHVYKTTDSLDGKPNIAFYVVADLKNKNLLFDADTTFQRRLTPTQFYQKNSQQLVVVNCTFFSFQTNQNLNVVIKNKKLVGYNIHSIAGRGKDTLTYRHPFGSALGLTKSGYADVAWLYTDSSLKNAYAIQLPPALLHDSLNSLNFKKAVHVVSLSKQGGITPMLRKWKMKTAVGGGPVLLRLGQVNITNNEELKFAGKAIDDKHPRTAIGYTRDHKIVILVIQGRFPGIAEGATLTQEAKILKDIGCWEALNFDGGGSSCMLINGKETIKPSDQTGQRPVPAVFIIRKK